MNWILNLIILLIISMLSFLIGVTSFNFLFNKKKCCFGSDNFKKCFGNKGSINNFKKTCCYNNDTWVVMNGLDDNNPNTNGFNKYCK